MKFTYSYLFRMISHEMKQKADRELEQFDITDEQDHTLGCLYAHQQDGLTQSDIAKALQRTGPAVSNLLRSLEREKLIRRYVDTQGTRRKNIGLTTSGIKLVGVFTPIFGEMERTLVSQLSEEENEQMEADLTKMLSSLQ